MGWTVLQIRNKLLGKTSYKHFLYPGASYGTHVFQKQQECRHITKTKKIFQSLLGKRLVKSSNM